MREKIGLHKIFVISLLVLTFLLMQLIVPWAWINDETVYVLMADSLTKRGVYTIENEYDGSPQFIIHASTAVDGRLLPVPPPMYPILYGLQDMFLGVYGLQLTNL